jgi:hypothetical protein
MSATATTVLELVDNYCNHKKRKITFLQLTYRWVMSAASETGRQLLQLFDKSVQHLPIIK